MVRERFLEVEALALEVVLLFRRADATVRELPSLLRDVCDGTGISSLVAESSGGGENTVSVPPSKGLQGDAILARGFRWSQKWRVAHFKRTSEVSD